MKSRISVPIKPHYSVIKILLARLTSSRKKNVLKLAAVNELMLPLRAIVEFDEIALHTTSVVGSKYEIDVFLIKGILSWFFKI